MRLSKLSSPLYAQANREKCSCKDSSITYAILSLSRHRLVHIFKQIDLKDNVISWWTDHDTTVCDHALLCQDALFPLLLHIDSHKLSLHSHSRKLNDRQKSLAVCHRYAPVIHVIIDFAVQSFYTQ